MDTNANRNMADMLYEKKKSGEVKFEGKIVRIEVDQIELADGSESFREVVRKNSGVCVVPLTDDGKIVLVNQFRYPYSEVVKEVPAGKTEPGEDPLVCGLRELSEETGYKAGKVVSLGIFYPSPGIMDEVLYMYLATELEKGTAHLDEGEFLTTETVSLEDAVQMVLDGKMPDGKTQSAILKTWILKQKGEI